MTGVMICGTMMIGVVRVMIDGYRFVEIVATFVENLVITSSIAPTSSVLSMIARAIALRPSGVHLAGRSHLTCL